MAAVIGKWQGGIVSIVPPTTYAVPTSDLFNSGSAVRNDGTAYALSSSARLTLPSSALADGYLLRVSSTYDDTSSGRVSISGRIVQISGTGNYVPLTSGTYSRDANNDKSTLSCAGFIDNPSASATFDFQWQRGSDAPTGGTTRSIFEIIPFFYADIGMYTGAGTELLGGTTRGVTTLSATVVEGTNITRSANVVTVTGDNKRYFIISSNFSIGRGGTARTQRIFGLDYDGTADLAAQSYAYYRQTSADHCGGIIMDIIETVTASRTIESTTFRGLGVANGQGGADVDSGVPSSTVNGLVVLELNDAAECFRTSDATGLQALDGTPPVDINAARTTGFIDAASWLKVGTVGMENNKGATFDAITGANVWAASTDVTSTVRGSYQANITVDGVEDADLYNYAFIRGEQASADTFGWAANPFGFRQLTDNQDLGVSVTQIGQTHATDTQAGTVGFWGINLETMAVQTQLASGTPSIDVLTASGVAVLAALEASGTPSIDVLTASGVVASAANITNVTPSTFDFDNIDVDIIGTSFAAVQGTGQVWISDASTLAGSVNEVEIDGAINTWGDTTVNLNFSGMTQTEIDNLHTLGPGTSRWIILENDSGEETSFQITLHRPQAFQMVLGAATPGVTTSRLTGLTGTFGGGRIEETAAQNPSTTTTNVANDGNREDVWSIEAKPNSVFDDTYDFRVLYGGNVADTITQTPQVTVSGILESNGTPSIDTITASGTAIQIQKPSGTPTIDTITASGTATQIQKPSGAATLAAITAVGVAIMAPLEGTGAPTIDTITASGTVIQIQKPSGTPSIDVVTASGVVTQFVDASGTPSIDTLTASGTVVLAPRVWLNATETLSGATQMTLTAYNLAGTSATFTDPVGAPTGALFLGVENQERGGGEANTGWIAVTVNDGTISGSGTPTIDAVTAAGNVIQIQLASGTPALDVLTAAGVARFAHDSSGTPSIDTITASGVVTQFVDGAGTPSIDTLTASGTVVQTQLASGTPALDAVTASGVAALANRANGTPALDTLTASGSVIQTQLASGTPSIDTLTAAGVARFAHDSSGTPSIDTITASGVATQFIDASGTPAIDTITAAGVVDQTQFASGTPTLDVFTASGVVALANRANGTPAIDGITAAGTVIQTQLASGTPSIDTITASGVVTQIVDASGTPSIDVITASGVSTQFVDASGTPSIDTITASGVVTQFVDGSGTPSIDTLTASGTVTQTQLASGTPSIDVITASGTAGRTALLASGTPAIDSPTAAGTVIQTQFASGTPSIDAVTASGSVIQTQLASGTPSIDTITASGVGLLQGEVAGTGSPIMDGPTAVGTVVQTQFASGTPSIDAVTASGVVTQFKKADGTPSIDVITASGTAVAIPPLFASGTPLIDSPTAVGVVDQIQKPSGTPSIDTVTAAGVVTQFVDGSGTPSIDVITASGTVFAGGIAAASGTPSIDVITAAGNATQIYKPSGTPSIDAVTATGTVIQTQLASGTPSIDGVTASGTAVAIPPLESNGTPSIDVITAAGVARFAHDSSGTPSIDAITASGVASILNPASGAASTDVITASGLIGQRVYPGAATLTLTGQAPSVERDFFIDVAPATLSLTTYIPDAVSGGLTRPAAATLSLSGKAPSFTIVSLKKEGARLRLISLSARRRLKMLFQ